LTHGARALAIAAVALATLAAAAAAVRGIALVDQRGAPVRLAGPPDRIVTIPMPAASMIAALDRGPSRLVGMHPNALTAIEGEVLGSIYPALTQVRTDIVRGGQFVPNIETLLALRPDLVVQWANQPRDVIGAIERAGLPVYGMRFGSQAELETWIEHFGTLVGARERAQAVVGLHRAIRAEIETRTAAMPPERRPKVLSFQRFTTGLRPSGAGSYADFTIGLAGGRNAAAALPGTAADVGFEQVLAWDPDVILLGGFDAALPQDLRRDPRWRALRAVRKGRVYKWPLGGYRWDPPSHEAPLAWLWLHALLHPGAPLRDLRAQLREFFERVYDYRLTDAEIDHILRVEANAGGLHYEQFTRR
jgi:iron complex transport system substrate-binding protein